MLFWCALPVIAVVMVMLDMMTERSARSSLPNFCLAFVSLSGLSVPLFLAGDMGVDYSGYKYFYDNIPTFIDYLSGADLLPLNLEPGYQVIVMLAKSMGLGVRGPVFLLYLLSCYVLFLGCKVGRLPPLTVSALFVLLIYPDFYGQQRMAFAYACGVLILGYLSSQKPNKIILAAMLASTIQYVSLAYLATLVVYFVDHGNFNYRHFLTHRVAIILGTMRKIFSRDSITYAVPIGLLLCVVLLSTTLNEQFISYLVSLFGDRFGIPLPFIDKFLSYYSRNSQIELSYLGSIASGLLIFILVLTYSDSPIYWKLRFGIAFLIISVLTFFFLESLPFMSYRVTKLFYLAGMAYIGSIILFSKRSLYIAPAALIFLMLIRYSDVVIALGPYKF